MSASGDCFVVLPPNCAENTIIVGRNAIGDVDIPQELHFYETSEAIEGKADGGASPNLDDERLRLILQKPKPGVWGGDYGVNDANVCICITWSNGGECENECLLASDVVRYVLASTKTARGAVDACAALVKAHGNENIKSSLLICDPKEAWIFSCAGNLWAAELIKGKIERLPNDGLAVTTSIDKSSDGLEDALKALGSWNGEGPLNFAACFDAVPTPPNVWNDSEPIGDGAYTLISMFETLRSAAVANSRAASVSILNSTGISCHWFTVTPNANESVFKPFIFAPQPKISPLTKANADKETTLLHQLHQQRKPTAMNDLKLLEASCVAEVSAYLDENPIANDELDELLKDCVEAEVKFYR